MLSDPETIGLPLQYPPHLGFSGPIALVYTISVDLLTSTACRAAQLGLRGSQLELCLPSARSPQPPPWACGPGSRRSASGQWPAEPSGSPGSGCLLGFGSPGEKQPEKRYEDLGLMNRPEVTGGCHSCCQGRRKAGPTKSSLYSVGHVMTWGRWSLIPWSRTGLGFTPTNSQDHSWPSSRATVLDMEPKA